MQWLDDDAERWYLWRYVDEWKHCGGVNRGIDRDSDRRRYCRYKLYYLYVAHRL